MSTLTRLLDNNAAWAAQIVQHDPRFFERLTSQQTPEYLWIGCSDSRVPANEIVGLPPGELFVHRNVANVVAHTDLNCLSVLQYAIDVLKVKHVIVTGHYGCGGVRAVSDGTSLGLIDNWLRHVDDVRHRHMQALSAMTPEAAFDRLCELNVIEQARHVCGTTAVRDAWTRSRALTVHGWIYRLSDGLLRDVGFAAAQLQDVEPEYTRAVKRASATEIRNG